jgi:hypothetical protein
LLALENSYLSRMKGGVGSLILSLGRIIASI